MMIGGGSREKDRGQWNGWGLEDSIKRPAVSLITLWTPTNPAGGLKFVDLHLLESTYINRKRRTKRPPRVKEYALNLAFNLDKKFYYRKK